ncbi:hypothetical protein [Rhizobium sp. RAF56]|uniref:hypothetical protein n=1 Tax=Rhizobium sp. RAF56 TaxID=3233062 RepID=UPI003F9D8D82
MRKYVGTVVASLYLAIGWGCSAEAGYQNDYASWKGLSLIERYAYFEGLFDGQQNGGFIGDPPYAVALRSALSDCAVGLHLTPAMIEGGVTRHYEAFPRDWGFSPAMIVSRVTQEVCIDYINAARSKLQLAPWEAPSGSISEHLKHD